MQQDTDNLKIVCKETPDDYLFAYGVDAEWGKNREPEYLPFFHGGSAMIL
jgi:hypothetical protein